MKNIDLIVMGKTGAGKSTLINAVLEEDLAPTGIGHAVTKRNEVFSKKMMLPIGDSKDGQYGMIGCQINMYDTVGLEIDKSITDQTLEEIRKHIEETKTKMSTDDIHLVWFCVNNRSSRFEPYELDLIRKLSIDYEIPFVIVLTQCFSDEEGELEEQIRKNLPEVSRYRVLAKDYSSRGGVIPAYGLQELIRISINDYKFLKVNIIEKKIDALDKNREERIKNIEIRGNQIINDYGANATKIGFIPGGCIPIVHGMCIKMIADLNSTAGFKSGKEFAEEIFTDAVLGLIATPFMVVPLLSAAVAYAYVQTVGESYLKALISVIHLSSDRELANNELMKKRLKEELSKLKK
jgi:GTPase SAR1 family protein